MPLSPMVGRALPPLVRAAASHVVLDLRGGASHQAGLLASTASLTKNILGIGVLTVAAGMAAGTGVGPATLAMGCFHAVAAYTFVLLGDLCHSTALGESCSFEGLWSATLGESSSWIVSACIGALTFTVCTVYMICLGELLPPLLTVLRAPRALCSRRAAVLLAASVVVPSCLPSSLAGLSAVSLLGVGALLYTALFSLLRWADASYAPAPAHGRLGAAMPAALRPRFARTSQPWLVSKQTGVLVANLGVALCAHFNAPGFYRSLAAATPARFAAMSCGAFGGVFILTLLIALPGYFTFGDACQPLILSNYHPTDDGYATCARLATAASLACSFPLVFAALREAALALAARALRGGADAAGVGSSRAAWWAATILLPSLAVLTALAVDDLGLVVGLLGSVLGGAIMYVAPASMHAAELLRATGSGMGTAAAAATRGVSRRRLALAADAAIVVYGVLGQMVVGTAVTLRQRGAGGGDDAEHVAVAAAR